MRQTRNGSLLIQINGGTDSAKIIKDEAERSFGPNAKVRVIDDSTAVEVRDLDEITTKEEVLEAVLALDGPSGSRVVSFRKAYGGAQMAIVLLPRQVAKRHCVAGRLRVGLVNA